MAEDSGLFLVGIGMGGVDGMTGRALSCLKSTDYRFIEGYTAIWDENDFCSLVDDVGFIEKIMRPEVEEPARILNLAKTHKVALMVVGDPLQATTHVDLQLQAIQNGVKCEVIHGISITNLVTGAIGLSNYRFGRQTTLTYPYNNWVATSPLEIISLNRMMGLHTLVLFDLDPTGEGIGNQQPMQPIDAMGVMEMMVIKIKKLFQNNIKPNNKIEEIKHTATKTLLDDFDKIKVVLCSDMGTRNQKISYGFLQDLKNQKKGRMHCMVIPTELNDVEIKALARWAKQS